MFRNETNYVLTNGVLLDGTEKMTPQTGRDIYIEGGRIGAVADAAARREGYEVVDLGGQYVLPGLINLHVHLPASGKPKKKASDPKKLVKLITANALTRRIGVKLCEGYAKTELLSGVTTIRTVGGVADFDTIIRDLAAQGKILSPRVVASNMAVSVPGGHMVGSLAYEAKTPEEAAAYVERIAAEKPDLIKLMITGGVLDAEVVGEPGVLRMQPARVKAACDKAPARGGVQYGGLRAGRAHGRLPCLRSKDAGGGRGLCGADRGGEAGPHQAHDHRRRARRQGRRRAGRAADAARAGEGGLR